MADEATREFHIGQVWKEKATATEYTVAEINGDRVLLDSEDSQFELSRESVDGRFIPVRNAPDWEDPHAE